MAKEKCHDSISSVVTQGTKYRRRVVSRQKKVCRDRTREESNKSIETKRDNVATRFLMLDVKTRRNLSRHNSSCCDIRNK